MMYYVLDMNTGTFVVRNSAEKVGTYLLGRCIDTIIIFKSDQDGDRSYAPMNGDVFKIQKDLEEL